METQQIVGSPAGKIRLKKIWNCSRDAARSLVPLLGERAVCISDEIAKQTWDIPAEKGFCYRDLFLSFNDCQSLIFDAAYAGAHNQCPTHGDAADETGKCGCGCQI